MRDRCEGFCCTKIEHLSVKDGSKSIIEDINLHIHCGEMTALIGPNGAGKSTLFKALIGIREYSGNIGFVGHDEQAAKGIKIGYVPQSLSVDRDMPVSVLDMMLSGISSRPAFLRGSKQRIAEVGDMLTRLDVLKLIDSRVSDLSGGELQRVLLGFALMPHPNILLLDEPVSGVDKLGEDRFFDILSDIRNENDLAIIIITHDLKRVLTHADKVILLNKTVITSGNPEVVFNDERFIDIFGRINKN